MLYRFKSQATADLVMLNDTGEQVLAAMGKAIEPRGIITVAQIPGALARLAQAVADSETKPKTEDGTDTNPDSDSDEAPQSDVVRLRQRAAPMAAMLKESLAAGKDVVWGV